MLKELSIHGLRGFGEKEVIKFSLPNGNLGSGLNVIVGPNNSGKTTITEAIRFYNGDPVRISFSEGKRNKKNKEIVEIGYCNENDKKIVLKTVENGGSQVNIEGNIDESDIPYVLQSRRHVNYQMYNNHQFDRQAYLQNQNANLKNRMSELPNYEYRIFRWQKEKEKFDETIKMMIKDPFDWTIEQNDEGSYYIKVMFANKTVIHTREGIGDGYWSIFTIADVLYDSEPGNLVVIDEPELSLHPALQKRVLNTLEEYAKDRQIIITTHSPYFISLKSLVNGGNLIRTYKDNQANIRIGWLEDDDREFINSTIANSNNPHILGLDARELFFIEDNIIITEGQEDVVIIPKICEAINSSLNATLYGWGVGGAGNIDKVLNMLSHLKYKKVTAIYDGDKKQEYEECKKLFPQYNIMLLFEDDIRDKEERHITAKNGVTDSKGKVKEKNIEKIKNFFSKIRSYHSKKKIVFSFNRYLTRKFGQVISKFHKKREK